MSLGPWERKPRRAFVLGRKPRTRCLVNTATAKKRDLAIPLPLPPLVSAHPDTLIMELGMDAWMPWMLGDGLGLVTRMSEPLASYVMPLCSWLVSYSADIGRLCLPR